MGDDLESNLGNFSNDFHLLPIQNFRATPERERHKSPRKPVPSNRSHESYQALEVDEEPNDAPNEELASDEAPIAESAKGNEPDFDRSWPSSPKRLNEWTWMRYAIFGVDIILTSLPMIFLVFGICALALDRKPLSSLGNNIIVGIKFGPTVFPIVFAAIVSRLMRSVAQWKAETGTKLGLLEQLVGSQNLTSAIQRLVLLQRYSPLGFAIVVLWLLSPLGGQSSLRILDTVSTTVLSEAQLHYFDVNFTSIGAFDGSDALELLGPSVSALFQASLLASKQVKSSPVDLWNNVKIPMIDELSPWTKGISGNPWIDIDQTSSSLVYSSLSGLNVNGLPKRGEALFTIETSYMQLTCGDGKVFYEGNGTGNDSLYTYVFPDGLQWHNATYPFTAPVLGYDVSETSSFFMDMSYARVFSVTETDPLNLLYGSQLDQNTLSMTLYNCTVGTARVEAGISCNGESCTVNRMRRSTVDTRSPLVVPFVGGDFWNFCLFIAFATGRPHDAEPAPIDYYVLGSDSPFSPGINSPSFANVTGDMFAKRLSTLINTLWQASLGTRSLALGPSAPWADQYSEFSGTFNRNYFASTTTANISNEVQLYHSERIYIGILLTLTTLLQICAVVGLVLKYMATAPDVLGYVSTQTRDNQHVEVPIGGNVLDGLERARLLGGMKVQIGDVRWEGKEGHIAFRSVQRREDWALGRVKKGRLYI
jgi:hypothetical protein